MANKDYEFSVGDKVVHSHHGGGVIVEITTMMVSNDKKEYYVFQSIIDETYKYFIPVDSVQARNLVKVKEVDFLKQQLALLQSTDFYLTDDLNEHKKITEEIIDIPSVESATSAINRILAFYAKRAENGKDLRQSNRAMLKRAKKILSSHVALAEDTDYASARQLVNEMIDKLVPVSH